MFVRLVIALQTILIVLLSLKLYSTPDEKYRTHGIDQFEQHEPEPNLLAHSKQSAVELCTGSTTATAPNNSHTNVTEQVIDPVNQKSIPAEQAATADHSVVSGNATLDFSQQEFDYQWAPEFSTGLHNIFQQSKRLNMLKVKDIECRTSLCKISVLSDGQQSLEMGVSIGMALAEAGLAEHAYQFATKSDNGVFTVFVGRSKDSIRTE